MCLFHFLFGCAELFLTSLIPFFPALAQMPVAMVVATLYMMAILLVEPYIRRWDDIMHRLTQSEIYLFCCAGFVLQYTTGQTLDPFINILLSAVLIFLTCFVILGFFLGVLFHFRKWWFKTLRQMRKQMAMDMGTEDVDTSFLRPVAVGEVGTLQEGRLRRRGSLGKGVSATDVVSFMWSRRRSASFSNVDLSQLAAKDEDDDGVQMSSMPKRGSESAATPEPSSPKSPKKGGKSPRVALQPAHEPEVELTLSASSAAAPAPPERAAESAPADIVPPPPAAAEHADT